MKEFKGTKGEWEVSKDNPKIILTSNGAYKPNDVMLSLSSAPEMQANAKLIAASPTLLSEHQMDLKRLKTWKKQLIYAGLKGSIMYQEYLDMIFSKEKAISKALD